MLRFNITRQKKTTLWPLFIMDGVQLPQGYNHFKEAVYLTTSSDSYKLNEIYKLFLPFTESQKKYIFDMTSNNANNW